MKAKTEKTLKQQARWQGGRAAQSWPEKVRQALILREASVKLKAAPTVHSRPSG